MSRGSFGGIIGWRVWACSSYGSTINPASDTPIGFKISYIFSRKDRSALDDSARMPSSSSIPTQWHGGQIIKCERTPINTFIKKTGQCELQAKRVRYLFTAIEYKFWFLIRFLFISMQENTFYINSLHIGFNSLRLHIHQPKIIEPSRSQMDFEGFVFMPANSSI